VSTLYGRGGGRACTGYSVTVGTQRGAAPHPQGRAAADAAPKVDVALKVFHAAETISDGSPEEEIRMAAMVSHYALQPAAQRVGSASGLYWAEAGSASSLYCGKVGGVAALCCEGTGANQPPRLSL